MSAIMRTIRFCFIVVLVITMAYFGYGQSALADESVDEWMAKTHEPWQDNLVGLWPNIEKMISIVYPIALKGNVRAQLTFSYYITLTNDFPKGSAIAGKPIADLRDKALLWSASISKQNSEDSKIAEQILDALMRQDKIPEMLELQ